jgi:hypothetical protein
MNLDHARPSISRNENAARANWSSEMDVAVGADAFSEKASQRCPYEWELEVV